MTYRCPARLLGLTLAIAGIGANAPAAFAQTNSPLNPLASALYDALTGQITVTAQNVYSWYVESHSGGFLNSQTMLPSIDGALVTNNPKRIGHSSFGNTLTYLDHLLGPVAAPALPDGDLMLHYSPGYGLAEIVVPVPGGLAGATPSYPTPSYPTPGDPTPELPDPLFPTPTPTPPGAPAPPPDWNPPGGHDPASAFAHANYDAVTGALTVTASNVLNWYVESATQSLLSGAIDLPQVPGGLVSNNPSRVGHSSFESPLNYQDVSLTGVAAPGLTQGELTLHYSPGWGLPEVAVDIAGGLPYAPPPYIPPPPLPAPEPLPPFAGPIQPEAPEPPPVIDVVDAPEIELPTIDLPGGIDLPHVIIHPGYEPLTWDDLRLLRPIFGADGIRLVPYVFQPGSAVDVLALDGAPTPPPITLDHSSDAIVYLVQAVNSISDAPLSFTAWRLNNAATADAFTLSLNNALAASLSAETLTLSNDANVVIPEPATAVPAAALAGVTLGLRRRR